MYKPKIKVRPWQLKKQPVAPMGNRKRVEFYHTSRWTRYAKAYKAENPICRRCESKGIITPAEVVDHIIPLEICDDPWNAENHQPLCKKCNNAKAAEDKKMINKKRK
jgi:5-methylcytosine-specific restriction protein A